VNATRHGLTMDKSLFTQLVGELARRGRGERETGAFLLARAGHPGDGSRRPRVVAVAYYDDLDPGCLTGGITFTADGYTALATLCRRDGLQVVADIHTHPRGSVRQSPTDAAHPMTALPGHIALIAPSYARGVTSPADLGVHVLQTGGQWQSAYGRDAARIVQLTSARSAASRLQAVTRWLRSLTRTRRT
jgi:Prokaryotic homologs of the JAB domain